MSIHNLALLFKDCTVRSSTLRCFWLAIQVQRQPYLYGDWTRANVLEMFQPAPIILLAVYFFGGGIGLLLMFLMQLTIRHTWMKFSNHFGQTMLYVYSIDRRLDLKGKAASKYKLENHIWLFSIQAISNVVQR